MYRCNHEECHLKQQQTNAAVHMLNCEGTAYIIFRSNISQMHVIVRHIHGSQLLLIADIHNSAHNSAIAKAICLSTNKITLHCFEDVKKCMLLSSVWIL